MQYGNKPACVGLPPEWWELQSGVTAWMNDQAKKVCDTCPVKKQCRATAEAMPDPGTNTMIWGGDFLLPVADCINCGDRFMYQGYDICSMDCYSSNRVLEERMCSAEDCGGMFDVTVNNSRKKYCGRSCERRERNRRTRQKVKLALTPMVCARVDCGETFMPRHGSQTYCTPRCKTICDRARSRLRWGMEAYIKRSANVSRECEHSDCTERFSTENSRGRKRYCSALCRERARRDRRNQDA